MLIWHFPTHLQCTSYLWLFLLSLLLLRAPLDWFVVNGAHGDTYNCDSCNLAALLGSRSEITLHTLSRYRGPVSVFSVLLKHMDTPIGELPIEYRCDLAIQLARKPDCSPDLFLMALGCDSISGTAIIYRSWHGETLLHAVAGAVGQLATSGNIAFKTEEFERRLLGWKSIIQELVAGGADLHATFSPFYLGLVSISNVPKSTVEYPLSRRCLPTFFLNGAGGAVLKWTQERP